jgi:hypothetical protein
VGFELVGCTGRVVHASAHVKIAQGPEIRVELAVRVRMPWLTSDKLGL